MEHISYILNKNIEADRILKDITKLVSTIPQQDMMNYALRISLHKVADHIGDSHMPKICHNITDSTT